MDMTKEQIIELQREFMSRIRDDEDKKSTERLNVAFNLYYTISQHRKSTEIDVQELLQKADLVLGGRAYEVSEWCKRQCLPENTLNDLRELEKYNVIKQDYDVLDLTLSDVFKSLSKKSVGKDIVEASKTRYKATIERIKRDVMNSYVEKRNRLNPNGTLDRFLSGDELEEVNLLADEIIKTDPIVRSMNESNSNFAKIHDTMMERSVNMKYKFEKLKEQICNTARVTPESFDKFYAAVRAEQERRISNDVELSGDKEVPTMFGGVTELYNIDVMNGIVRAHAHLLVPVENDPYPDKPIYVSDILKVIDAVDYQDVARSTGNLVVKMTGYDDIWEKYNQLNEINEVQSINRIQGKDLETGIKADLDYKISGNNIAKVNKETDITIIPTNNKKFTFKLGADKSKYARPLTNSTPVTIDRSTVKIEDIKPKKKVITSLDDLI